MTVEEYQLTLLERDVTAGHVTPRCVGSACDVTSEPLGSGLLLIVQQFDVLSIANEQCDRILNQCYVNRINCGSSIIVECNLEWLSEVALSAACWTTCGILAAFNLEGSIAQVDTAVSHHAYGDSFVLLIDGTFHTLKYEEQ